MQRSSHAIGGLAALAATLALTGPGCGNERPPLLDDGDDASAAGGSDGGLIGDSGLTPPECSVGVEGGVCSCVDETLAVDPPNIYFVLDRSGSMGDPFPGTVSTKWTNVLEVIAQLVVKLGPRARYGVAVFPDAQLNGCAPGGPIFPPGPLGRAGSIQGDSPAGKAGKVETALLNTLLDLTPFGGTPTAATFRALGPTIEKLPGKTFVIFATDGGPNCNQGASCDADMCTDNIENQPINGQSCPPGGPPNCCDATHSGVQSCLDAQPTIDAVGSLAAAGVPVYVVGLPENASDPAAPAYPAYATLLDELAQAGGTARDGSGTIIGSGDAGASDAGTGDGSDAGARADAAGGDGAVEGGGAGNGDGGSNGPLYYAVTSADESAFLAAMSQIAAKITGTCTLTLDDVPPDPNMVNVFFDGTPLPQAGPDGWELAGQTVLVLGASCQKILDGDVLDVRVVAGCPTVTR